MWPWEHLAFGYVLYSATVHATWRRAPGGAEVVALAFATQFPDLVDKPLSWGFGVFPAGYAAGHSVFVAVPLSAAVVAVARRRGRGTVGGAFALGYVSHLAGDVLSPLVRAGRPALGRLLWPLVSFPSYGTDRGFVGRLFYYVGRYLAETAEPSNLPFLLAYAGVFLGVWLLWMVDGAPGVREALVALRAP